MKAKGWFKQADPDPDPHPNAAPLQHHPVNRPARRIPLSRLSGSALRSGSQMASLAFAFTVLVATIAL